MHMYVLDMIIDIVELVRAKYVVFSYFTQGTLDRRLVPYKVDHMTQL